MLWWTGSHGVLVDKDDFAWSLAALAFCFLQWSLRLARAVCDAYSGVINAY
jgi:hypothetical protein